MMISGYQGAFADADTAHRDSMTAKTAIIQSSFFITKLLATTPRDKPEA
jgi:hypothetical protein